MLSNDPHLHTMLSNGALQHFWHALIKMVCNRYEGGGIKREVHIERLASTHFTTGGVHVSPQRAPTGHITASAEVENWSKSMQRFQVQFTLRSSTGVVIAQNTSQVVGVSGGAGYTTTKVVACTLLPSVMGRGIIPWSIFTVVTNKTVHAPNALYTMTATLKVAPTTRDGAVLKEPRATAGVPEVVLDEVNATCGFRTTSWKSKFWLNGNETQLRGFSHHDTFAGVGAAIPARIFLFHAQQNRALGGNFWRMSHNPYDDVIYSMLDALGVMVWDEARDFYDTHLDVDTFRSLVKHHRNHPSIVVYGLCNEVECFPDETDDANGQNATVVAFKGLVQKLDPQRPISFNSVSETYNDLDVAGISHANENKFTELHQQQPSLPLVLSECCSCSSERGELSSRYRSSSSCMDEQNAPGWMSFVTGSIGVWTLSDYYGEQGSWPHTCAS